MIHHFSTGHLIISEHIQTALNKQFSYSVFSVHLIRNHHRASRSHLLYITQIALWGTQLKLEHWRTSGAINSSIIYRFTEITAVWGGPSLVVSCSLNVNQPKAFYLDICITKLQITFICLGMLYTISHKEALSVLLPSIRFPPLPTSVFTKWVYLFFWNSTLTLLFTIYIQLLLLFLAI